MESSRSRVTGEQRRIMLEFVKRHKSIITGRFPGPDAARQRTKILAEMANTLNSTGSGAVKTPEKWLRSLQDWKSDVKKKAAKIASYSRGTGGGPPMSELSDVERDLVDLIGESAISGHTQIPDPLEGPSSSGSNPTILLTEDLNSPSIEIAALDPGPSSTLPDEPPRPRKRKRDEDIDDRMAVAMERQAEALAEIGQQIGLLTGSLPRIAAAFERQAETLAEVGQQIGRIVDFLLMAFNRWTQQTHEL